MGGFYSPSSLTLRRLTSFALWLTVLYLCHAASALKIRPRPGSNSTRLAHPISRITNLYQCRGNEDKVHHALLGITLGLSHARLRLLRLKRVLERNPVSETSLSGIDRSTLYTFESLYGTSYLPNTPGGYIGRTRIEYVIDMMDRLIENIPGMGFDIWCDDSFLSQTGPPDAPLPPQPHENPHGDLIYWDNRPLEVNGQAWVLMPVPKCDEDLQAFHMDGGSREIIVLCPKMFEHYSDLGDYQIDMTSRPPTFSKGIHIDSFATSLMFVLVHEVSHCDFFLQNLVTSDIPADVDGYGWQEAVRHADNNHLYALKNADNFALFVLAMFLSKNDWSTGLSDDMFADAPAREFPP